MFAGTSTLSHDLHRAAATYALARNWWAITGRGITAMLFGASVILKMTELPGIVAYLFSAYLLVDGGFAIVAAVGSVRAQQRSNLLVAEGIFNLSMAIIAVVTGARTNEHFALLTALWAMLTGGLMLSAALI